MLALICALYAYILFSTISMSADAASLPCPICSHTGIFDTVQSLRDRLIHVSTNIIICPVCQEEVTGLDKLTIHLFSHVKLLPIKECPEKHKFLPNDKIKLEAAPVPQQKKPKSPTSKNKTTSQAATSPVKFVKIYPKLPIISLNTVPVIDISHRPVEERIQNENNVFVKKETSLVQSNTTCNICGLQFVDSNILRMHRCLIHNIDENSNQQFTRYHCHLCPKNFKMRGSLMVHLRVAHYGFLSGNTDATGNNDGDSKNEHTNTDDKSVTFQRHDNKQWQCDVCRKCFTTKYFLKKHKRLHTGETPYACTQCNKTFTFQQSYHKHLLYHNDEKPHTCTYCGRAFKELSTLHNHQRIHTGEKPFSCETCGKCFRQRVSYLVHRRIHTGVMPYKCTACEKSFRYKVSQRTHKCQAQPPGTVVRQNGDLVEMLKKKHIKSDSLSTEEKRELNQEISFLVVSEANAELVRSGAKLSLEDMESENFTLIADTLDESHVQQHASVSNLPTKNKYEAENMDIFEKNIEDLIDNNVPSPSEILKNLCIAKEEDYIATLQEKEDKSFDIYKELDDFL